ncbi:MAG TPA: nitroreductase/quinone reductase family protein [Candidatus Dormibacteraeota bacterium]|nr:nitroreductase/quinone reductase family protein [Candidatus Dormibacteraeota bacterium]
MLAYNRGLIEEFRATGGRVRGQMAGTPLLLLTTAGARSRRPRTTPLGYAADGSPDRLVLFASNLGAPVAPAWFRNLVANPHVQVELGAERFAARASVPAGAERERLYQLWLAAFPSTAGHQAKAGRPIPRVLVEHLARIRPLRGGEGRRWRELRLSALRDTPAAFYITYEEDGALDDAEWERRSGEFAAGVRRVMFVAEAGERLVGSAGVLADVDGPPELIAVWVAPDHRGRGVGEALMAAAIDWARRRGAPRLGLHVGSRTPHAIALYERLGFRRTGESMAMRDPAFRADEMVLDL